MLRLAGLPRAELSYTAPWRPGRRSDGITGDLADEARTLGNDSVRWSPCLGRFGCSDPVPPPAQASLFFADRAARASPGAGLRGHRQLVGQDRGRPARAPAIRARARWTVRTMPSIGCRVSGGGPFSLSGSAEQRPTGFTLLSGIDLGHGGEGTDFRRRSWNRRQAADLGASERL